MSITKKPVKVGNSLFCILPKRLIWKWNLTKDDCLNISLLDDKHLVIEKKEVYHDVVEEPHNNLTSQGQDEVKTKEDDNLKYNHMGKSVMQCNVVHKDSNNLTSQGQDEVKTKEDGNLKYNHIENQNNNLTSQNQDDDEDKNKRKWWF